MELDISGARIFFTLPINVPVLGPLRISETMVVSWIVMILSLIHIYKIYFINSQKIKC